MNISFRNFSVCDNVKVLKIVDEYIHLSIKQMLFIFSAWQKVIPNLGYSRHWKVASKLSFYLPTKNGKIDFEFMESFVAELEAQRVAELEAYLTVTGLKDYELTEEEKNALNNLELVSWKEFKVGELFDRISTNKLPYKAKDLPKEAMNEYVLPALTSSFMNQGLNYYVPKKNATILNKVISLPSNSDVYRAYFQSRDFTVLSDSYAIDWKDNYSSITTDKSYLFAVQCINKVTDLAIYSYKNKLGGWNVVKDKFIQLPIEKEKIAFNYMETLIRAVQKLVIKDVVCWADKKIEVTKKITNV